MVDWLVNKARELNLDLIEVETLPDSHDYKPYESTRAFYCAAGFKYVLYRKSSVLDHEDSLVMQKPL